MTDLHPVTPPPELVKQWDAECESGNNAEINSTFDALQQFACKAARWGSDQELEACCEHLKRIWAHSDTIDSLRAARRPKPKSRKQRALDALVQLEEQHLSAELAAEIRNALEALPDD